MKLNYNESGNRRKAMVKVISDTTGEKAVYKFTPTYNFEIGDYTVTRYGELIFPDDLVASEVIAALEAAGFEHDPVENAPSKTEDEGHEEAEETTETEAPADGLTIELPKDFFTEAALDNLQKLIDSKATLIKKALGTDALPVQVTDEKVSFPWFTELEPDAVAAYTKFISALCKMAKEATRVTATDKPVENEKYAFRCFLLRLGFIGSEYKADRKVLLKNLTGSSAFRSGQKGGNDEISE